MVQLNLDERKTDQGGLRVNWPVVLTVVIAVLGWVFAGLGDYRSVDKRVTTLEAQRIEDVRRYEADRAYTVDQLQRMNDKLDRVLERVR